MEMENHLSIQFFKPPNALKSVKINKTHSEKNNLYGFQIIPRGINTIKHKLLIVLT